MLGSAQMKKKTSKLPGRSREFYCIHIGQDFTGTLSYITHGGGEDQVKG